MHALDVAVSVFAVIFVAELPDKTALAALVLATKYRPWPVFFGAALALTVQSAVAVGAGNIFARLAPRPVHMVAGLVFLVSAIFMWLRKEEAPEEGEIGSPGERATTFWRAFTTVFGVVFIAEWGDLTQFATAALAARERSPWVVLIAATLALWTVTAIAVWVGRRLAHVLAPEVTKRVAAVVFAVVGGALLTGWL